MVAGWTLSRIGQSTHRWGRKGLLPQGPRSSPQLQAYNHRAHHCHSEHLFLLNVCVAPTTISWTQPQELHRVARATTVASIIYTAPAWWGFADEGDRHRLEHLILGGDSPARGTVIAWSTGGSWVRLPL